MQNNPLPVPLQQFVDEVTTLLDTENDESGATNALTKVLMPLRKSCKPIWTGSLG
ncbi:hypothetical protein [Thiothrix nivea]|uniref:hypothetical protein n=1 Tax=Thiothrix nivea TaxID=1031 RepID=UPI0012B68545|nr:hypothetical protein [Thiothrix nivea]